MHCLRSFMLQSGALAAEDMRWLWGPRTVSIGSNSSTLRAVLCDMTVYADDF
jgi:hypothetical protein